MIKVISDSNDKNVGCYRKEVGWGYGNGGMGLREILGLNPWKIEFMNPCMHIKKI